MKSAVSAQKALQGSKTEARELLGGMEDFPQRGVIDLLTKQFDDLYKKETEKTWNSGQTCCKLEPEPESVASNNSSQISKWPFWKQKKYKIFQAVIL